MNHLLGWPSWCKISSVYFPPLNPPRTKFMKRISSSCALLALAMIALSASSVTAQSGARFSAPPQSSTFSTPVYSSGNFQSAPTFSGGSSLRPAQQQQLQGNYYSPQIYAQPVYSQPTYSAPSYSAPNYSAPVYSAPTYSAPVYSAPVQSYSAPAYSAPRRS